MPPSKKASSSMEDLYFQSFFEYKDKYGPKTAILLQVGKFYEMYDQLDTATGKTRANVRELAEICGGAPDPKPADDGKSRIFWGFPEQSLPKYERILVNAGYTVVIINQERDRLGGVTGRTVGYVSSPGTYLDPECVNVQAQGEDRNILGILIERFIGDRGKPQWYVATSAFDISTGRCVSTESVVAIIDGKPVLDALEPFWSVYPPSETVVWTLDFTENLSEQTVCSWFSGVRGPVHVYGGKTEGVGAARGRQEFLSRIYKPDTSLTISEYLGLERHPFSFQCLARLMEFVNDHNPSFLAGIRDHRLWVPENELLLGNSALEQLSMIPSGIRASECLLHWLQKAHSAIGRRALRQRCLKPIADIEELEVRQNRIAELRDTHCDTYKEVVFDRCLRGIHDLSRLFRKFQLGRGTATDLLQILGSYERIAELIEATRGTLSEVPDIDRMSRHVAYVNNRWSSTRIRQCESGSSIGVIPAHPWARGVIPAMDSYEDNWRTMASKVAEMCKTWESLLGEDNSLKIECKEDTPFLITTTKRRATCLAATLKQRKKIEMDVVTRGSSSTSSVLTLELREINECAAKIWADWTTVAQSQWAAEWSSFEYIDELIDWVGQLDAEFAFARIANEYGYVRPTYHKSETAGISVRDMRHPILERVRPETTYIPHSVALGCLKDCGGQGAKSDLGILLYGVNAAGKSSLSKAIGLAVLMAQCGLPVAASEMHLAPYTALFTRILGNDNLWAGMSSFVVEMTEFRSILRSAGPRTLVLGDELCSGTETASAIAIVSAGIQTLVTKKTQFVFATHLHELMDISEVAELQTVCPYHLTVVSDSRAGGKLVYDRKLKEGAGSPMYGLEVCRGLDMDADFLRRAVDIRRRLENSPDMTKASRYNAAVPIQACNVCGANKGLETHHIRPQAAANAAGFVTQGIHKNDVGNLVVLCESCHDKHHRGDLVIRGWVQTTGGRKLSFD
jgi:DNA mismatch repair protein MutS